MRLTASPSIFGSITYATGSSVPSRLRTSSAHLTSASSVVTFSSEPICSRCRTFWKRSDSGAPTRCVGESGVTSSGLRLLERDQLVVEPVVLGVRDRRLVEHVVLVEVAVEQLAQLGGALRPASEDGIELVGRVDDRVRALRLHPLARVDAAPGDADRVDARRSSPRRCRTARRRRRRSRPDRRRAGRARRGSGRGAACPRGASSEPTTTSISVAEPERLERELDDVVPLRADDPERPALAVQPLEQVEHPRERLAARSGAARSARGRRGASSSAFSSSNSRICSSRCPLPDLRQQDVVGDLAAEHRLRRVPVRREDHPAGVDDRPVEVEEHHREPHLPDANDGGNSIRPVARLAIVLGVALVLLGGGVALGGERRRHVPDALREHLLRVRALRLRADRPALRDPQQGAGRCRRGRSPAATRTGATGYAMRQRGPAHVLCISDTIYDPKARVLRVRRRRGAFGVLHLLVDDGRPALHERERERLLPEPRALVRVHEENGADRRLQDAVREHRLRLRHRPAAGVDCGIKSGLKPPPRLVHCNGGDPNDKRVSLTATGRAVPVTLRRRPGPAARRGEGDRARLRSDLVGRAGSAARRRRPASPARTAPATGSSSAASAGAGSRRTARRSGPFGVTASPECQPARARLILTGW